MPMYNFIEYSSNYCNTTGSSWFYSKDEEDHLNVIVGNTNTFKSVKYKTKLLENTVTDGNNSILKNTTIAVHLNNFW